MQGETSGFRVTVTLTVLVLTLLDTGNGDSLSGMIESPKNSKSIISSKTKYFTPMHKALLTQRGYIQFLRWELPVPEIEEFTFCVWVKSTNLTYPHSIFSYSKNEKDRLVRAWISEYGLNVHLEINNVEMFSHPVYIQENRWYHICESWSNSNARYALWIDGEKRIDGYSPKMAGHVIPANGDIVLGQEYTDFDKGLEEGIEGAVLGFNLLLASAFDFPLEYFDKNNLEDTGLNGNGDPREYGSRRPLRSYRSRNDPRTVFVNREIVGKSVTTPNYAESVATDSLNEDSGIVQNVDGRTQTRRRSYLISRNQFIQGFGIKPLGQQLVDISYENCKQGRGSPRIGGKLMLISWTRTPVRVFGGAIIKNAKNDCGHF